MPLVKRAVHPSALCRQTISKNIKNELECVTNSTLSGVILQLSSLSIHAEDLFGELFTEANSFYSRATKLQDRIDKLSVKVTQLDSTVEEVSLHDINMRKAFRSSGITDQQVVSRESLSQTLRATYNLADKPPPLQNLNQYRDDGRDALKIYTDPDYFFNLWREAMQKEMRDAKEKRREQRKKERKANPSYRREAKVKAAVPRSRMKALQMRHGVELVDSIPPPSAKSQNHVTAHVPESAKPQSRQPAPDARPTATSDYASLSPQSNYSPDIPPPSPPPVSYGDLPPPITDLPEPPRPPPMEMNGSIPDYPSPVSALPPPIDNAPPPPPMNAPPPPAPPPPPVMDSSPPVNTGGMAAQLASVRLNKTEERAAPVDSRGGLLQAIRVGINLKKVEEREKTAAISAGGNDVASILARRIAVEFSDSESDSYMSDDDGEWDD